MELALAVWHRRKWLALLVLAGVLSAAVAVAWGLPDVYESTATVLVERQQVPENLVGSPEGDVETRLRTLSEQILSRSRLYGLITRFHLYPELQRRATPEAAAEQMRRDIRLQFNGVRQPTGLDRTIAFSLSYRGRNPQTVAQVTNALATLFVEENAQAREQQTAGATDFLRAQLGDAKRQVEEKAQKISAFKGRHIGELPEQQAENLAALERLNAQVRVLMDQRDALTRQLGAPPGAGSDTVPARLARLRQELADLRVRYTDAYPDVVRVKQEIAVLEAQRAPASAPGAPRPAAAHATVEGELAQLGAEERALRSQIAVYERRVENAPLIEVELQQLSQDYAAANSYYQSLLQRYEGAQLAQRMAQRLQAEQFRVLDPAVAAQHPVAPHRARLVLMGLMAAVGAAVGAAFLAETGDTSFHTVDDVRTFTSVPVLASIPPIVTEGDARRRRRHLGLAALASALGVAAVAGAAFYLGHSNDAVVRLLAAGRF